MPFTIDLSETFPHLPGAPIVEAVIHWRARAGSGLEPDALRQELAARLPEYPEIHPQHEWQFAGRGSAASSEISQSTRWHGFRLERNGEGRYVAQFTSDGLIVSRLAPYDCWETFEAEALRLWDVYVDLASPTALQRLGVRFINRIELSAGEKPGKYLRVMPKLPKDLDLPVETFVHRDVLTVPDSPFHVNLLRTIQSSDASRRQQAVILDIDVYAIDVGIVQGEPLRECLTQMRWIKNKVFFSLITPRARQLLGESKP